MRFPFNMSSKRRFIVALSGFTVLFSVTLATVYIHRSSVDLTDRFRERAEFYTQYFADWASPYISQGRREELDILAKTVVFGSVLYTQVVKDGEVLIDNRSNQTMGIALPVEDHSAPLVVKQGRAPDGHPYLDIIRTLAVHDAEAGQSKGSYVRIGTSLLQLHYEIRNEILIVSGVSLAFIVIALLVTFYLAKALFGRRKVLELAREPASVTGTEPRGLSGIPSSSSAVEAGAPTVVGSLILDDRSKRVSLREEAVELSPKEYELLKLLASQPGKVFSNEEILERVWVGREFATYQDVKQYIYFLRRKLEEDPESPQMIITVRGFGYKLVP